MIRRWALTSDTTGEDWLSVEGALELGVSRAYERDRDEETLGILREALDEATLAEAMDAGRTLTVEAAVAIAAESASG